MFILQRKFPHGYEDTSKPSEKKKSPIHAFNKKFFTVYRGESGKDYYGWRIRFGRFHIRYNPQRAYKEVTFSLSTVSKDYRS